MDKHNDVVILNLDRPRKLRCSYKALKTITALTGLNIDQISEENAMRPDVIEGIMYALMLQDAKDNGETLTLDMMEDLLDQGSLDEITQKMEEAFTVAFPDAMKQANGAKGKNVLRAASTGKKP